MRRSHSINCAIMKKYMEAYLVQTSFICEGLYKVAQVLQFVLTLLLVAINMAASALHF